MKPWLRRVRPTLKVPRGRALLPYAGILLVNLVPLVGVAAFGWSILEVVAYVWVEAVALTLSAALRAGVRAGAWGVLVAPAYVLLMSGVLVLQALLLTLAFFVMRFQDDFQGVVAEGAAVVRGLAWGAGLVGAWHLVGFALFLADRRARPRPWWRELAGPTVRVLALVAATVAAAYVVRDLRVPAGALALLVLAKAAVDLGLHAALRPKS